MFNSLGQVYEFPAEQGGLPARHMFFLDLRTIAKKLIDKSTNFGSLIL
jgi:hypothetical protein